MRGIPLPGARAARRGNARPYRRLVGAALAIALVGPVGAVPSTASATIALDVVGPLIAGASSYVDGTYAWTDYAYDDRGANTEINPGGDLAYPSGAQNTADLIQVQVAPAADGFRVTGILETLRDGPGSGDRPVLGIAFDTDADSDTGAARLPGSAWVPQGPLGVEMLVILTVAGGEVRRFEGGEWSSVAALSVDLDYEANGVSTVVPTSILAPGAASWRAFAVAGIAQQSWLDGGPIYDLGFVRDDIFRASGWQDDAQAEILAGTRASSEAAAIIDFAKIFGSASEIAEATAGGYHTLLFRSALRLPESTTSGSYLGPYQPYLVVLPEQLPQPPPMIVLLHGGSGTHMYSSIMGPDSGYVRGIPANPTTPRAEPFIPPAVVIMPLGRGENIGWQGIGEVDALEATEDAIARYGVDRDRIVLGGLSLGGLGTFRLGLRYPDRWSFIVPTLSGIETSALASTRSQVQGLENLANLPMNNANNGILFGGAAAFAPGTQVDTGTRQMMALGYEFRQYTMAARAHEYVPALFNCLWLRGLERQRVKDPARVVYSVFPSWFVSDPQSGMDLRYDSAYWVSGMRVRAGAARGGVDLTSLARADRVRAASSIDGYHENATADRDFCGPKAGSRTFDVWREVGTVLTPGEPAATSNALAGRIEGLDEVRVDVGRTSIDALAPVSLELTGDGPTILHLAGDWPARVSVQKDGEHWGVIDVADGVLTLNADLRGTHVWTLSAE